MKIVALMPVKTEAWVLYASLSGALLWADEVVVLLHECTDNSADIAARVSDENPGKVFIKIGYGEWEEGYHCQAMLDKAIERGATHVCTIEADEFLSGNLIDSAVKMARVSEPGRVLCLPWVHLWRSLDEYRNDGNWGKSYIQFMSQVCSALHFMPLGAHESSWPARHPINSTWIDSGKHETGGILRLHHADWRRMLSEEALRKLTEKKRYPKLTNDNQLNAKYGSSLDERNLTTAHIPWPWWEPYQGLTRQIAIGDTPWQEAECESLAKSVEHQHLDLYGVVK